MEGGIVKLHTLHKSKIMGLYDMQKLEKPWTEEDTNLANKLAGIYASKFKNLKMTRIEVMQEVFIAYMQAKETYIPNGEASFKTYASRCIRNHLIDLHRKVKSNAIRIEKEKASEDKNDMPEPIAESNDDDEEQAEKDFRNLEIIAKIFERNINKTDKSIFDLYKEKKYTYKQMAEKLNKPEKEIKGAIQRVRGIFRALLES